MPSKKIENNKTNNKKDIEKLWEKCNKCENIIYIKELIKNYKVCPKCNYYFNLTAKERIEMLVDNNSFKEYDKDLEPEDILGFPEYKNKLKQSKQKTKLNDAVITGEGTINTHKVILCVLDFEFMGGSMGSIVGEKITRAIEKATSEKLPLIIVSASGGARMQEGIISLMQMAKTSAALAKFNEEGLLFISILTNPTTGGVTASFATLGDIIIAEPKALIGFTGPRVIEQTIKQKLPDEFQLSEFLLKHGAIDLIVERKNMKDVLTKILNFYNK